MTPVGIKAATNEQRIAVLPIDTDKAGNFAYLGPAIEEALNSRLYKPGIIIVVSSIKVNGADARWKAKSAKAPGDAAKDLGAKYFITGKVSSDGKTPELTLQLMEAPASRPITSLSLKNALADDVLTKIDGFVAETADAIITGPRSPARQFPEDMGAHADTAAVGIKTRAPEAPQKPRADENNAMAMARINPDYFFYKKLDEIMEQKDNAPSTPSIKKSQKDTNKAGSAEKEAKEAYENVLPYPAPSEVSKETKKTNKNDNAQVAANLKKATRKDSAKIPLVATSSRIPYPTPEEIEARDISAASAVPETTQIPQRANESWLSWILNPFKAKKQNDTQVLNKPSPIKEKDRAALPAAKNTKSDAAGAATTSDGPIWQWY